MFRQELAELRADWQAAKTRDYEPFLVKSREEFQAAKKGGFRNQTELKNMVERVNAKLAVFRELFRDSLYDFAKYKLTKTNILRTIPAKLAAPYGVPGYNELSQRHIEGPMMTDRLVVNIISPKIDVVFNDSNLLAAFQEIQEKDTVGRTRQAPTDRPGAQIGLTPGPHGPDKAALRPLKIQLEDFFEHKQQYFGEIFRHVFFNNEFKIKAFKDSLLGPFVVSYALGAFRATSHSQKIKTLEVLRQFDKLRDLTVLDLASVYDLLDAYRGFVAQNSPVEKPEDNRRHLATFNQTLTDRNLQELFATLVFENSEELADDGRPQLCAILLMVHRGILRLAASSESVGFDKVEHFGYILFAFYGSHFVSKMFDTVSDTLLRSTMYDPSFNQRLASFLDLLNETSLAGVVSPVNLTKLRESCEYLQHILAKAPFSLRFPFSVNFCEAAMVHHIRSHLSLPDTSLLSSVDQLKHIYLALDRFLDLEQSAYFGIMFKYAYHQRFKVNMLMQKPIEPKSVKLVAFLDKVFSGLDIKSAGANFAIVKGIDAEVAKGLSQYVPQETVDHFGFLLSLLGVLHRFKKAIGRAKSVGEEVLDHLEAIGQNSFTANIKAKFTSSVDSEVQVADFIGRSEEIIVALDRLVQIFTTQNLPVASAFISAQDPTFGSPEQAEGAVSLRFVKGLTSEFRKILAGHRKFSQDIIKSLPLLIILVSNFEERLREMKVG